MSGTPYPHERGGFCPFPPVSRADETGLLMIGGHLSPDWLLAAYARGIFPWPIPYDEGGPPILAWFSPDPRAVLPLDKLHVPRRLERRLRRGEFQFTLDQAFDQVIRGCAGPRPDHDSKTWITSEMRSAYRRLHRLDYAHSVEVWQSRELVGGIYGVSLGGYFAGESMFRRVSEASKAALVFLARHLRARGFLLFDIQQWSAHTAQLGALEISRREFLRQLQAALAAPVTFRPPSTPAATDPSA